MCGRPNALDNEWHQAKAKEAEELRKAAREATEAREGLKRATAAPRAQLNVDRELLKTADPLHRGRGHPIGSGAPAEPARGPSPFQLIGPPVGDQHPYS